MNPKVTVLGWYDKKNVGDESYKMAFPLVFPGYDFHFTDTLTPQTINESDAFILGGGDIMSPSMVSQLDSVKKPKHIISATASNANVNAKKLKEFETILVRDYHSIELLGGMGVNPSWMPDLAMVLRGKAANGKAKLKSLFHDHNLDMYEHVVIVVVNSYLLNEDHPLSYTHKFVDFLEFSHSLAWVADNTPASFVFLPFGGRMPFDDRVTNAFVASRCKFWKKNVLMYEEPDVQTTLDIFCAADVVISSRLHSSILSCANSIPFIDITWNHKNRWFLETIGRMDLSMSYKVFDPHECKEMLHRMLMDPKATREAMHAVAKKQTSIIENTTKFQLCPAKPVTQLVDTAKVGDSDVS